MARSKPIVVVTRKLPEAVETRMTELFEVRLNVDDHVFGRDELRQAGKTCDVLVPRFVSLRTDPVNLRVGPGMQYQVEWVYLRRGLPVEVIAEFETWRRIRDSDGAEGWVHQSMLSARRTALVRGEGQPKDPKTMGLASLRKGNNDQSEALAALEPGVVVTVQRCPAGTDYCRIEIAGHQGWLKRGQLWGLTPSETID